MVLRVISESSYLGLVLFILRTYGTGVLSIFFTDMGYLQHRNFSISFKLLRVLANSSPFISENPFLGFDIFILRTCSTGVLAIFFPIWGIYGAEIFPNPQNY